MLHCKIVNIQAFYILKKPLHSTLRSRWVELFGCVVISWSMDFGSSITFTRSVSKANVLLRRDEEKLPIVLFCMSQFNSSFTNNNNELILSYFFVEIFIEFLGLRTIRVVIRNISAHTQCMNVLLASIKLHHHIVSFGTTRSFTLRRMFVTSIFDGSQELWL